MNAQGPGSKDGIKVDGTNVIIKNCDIRNFDRGIVNNPNFRNIFEIESTTVANNGEGISGVGLPTLKNVAVENNNIGLGYAPFSGFNTLVLDNVYFCNNAESDIFVQRTITCAQIVASGTIFASKFGPQCGEEAAINTALEENGDGPIVSCNDLNAQQSLAAAAGFW